MAVLLSQTFLILTYILLELLLPLLDACAHLLEQNVGKFSLSVAITAFEIT